MTNSTNTPWVQQTAATLGADIHGIDLRAAITEETMRLIFDAWSQYLVLRFNSQRLSDADLVSFSRRFGHLDKRPELGLLPGEAEDALWIVNISNVVEEGRAKGALGYGEAAWHADMTYNPEPPSASLLYALEIPADGGATWFSNMYAAYEDLDPALKRRIKDLHCIHDASHDSTGRLRSGFVAVMDPRDTPGAHHPFVTRHPVTGRPSLFLGRRAGAYIPELATEESERLLDQLWAHATQDRYLWKHHWRVGDLIIWDNRCVLHRRDAFDPAQRRTLHRTQVRGSVPQRWVGAGFGGA